MARSLFQRPRGTGFQGRFAPDFADDGDAWLRRGRGQPSQPRRWPLIVRVIGFLFAIAFGIFAATAIWLLAGALLTG